MNILNNILPKAFGSVENNGLVRKIVLQGELPWWTDDDIW